MLSLQTLFETGSHNTMTYTIERNNDVGPDVSKVIRVIGRFLPILSKPIIYNWSVNQIINVKEQLNNGIRYLDLRVAKKSVDDKIYFLHGLFGAEVNQPLKEIADWLSTHPQETLILDFQHFYKFSEADHLGLIDQVKYVFRGKMCPASSKLDHLTLEWMKLERYQVIVVYRNIVAQNFSNLWPSGLWPTPWPDTVNKDRLVNFLTDGLRSRSRSTGYVSQCVLTPDVPYVIKHIFGTLQRNLCVVCSKVTLPWIENNSPGNGGLNIVISDEVSYNNYVFPKTVIQRNVALL